MQHLSGSGSTDLASEKKFWEHSGYRISRYRRDQLPEVVKLLQPLLGGQPAQNLSYFQWKHHDNPYTSEPLGVTATRDGVVVGFRGYFATPWYLGSKDKRTIILVPGDTVVHPEHRVKGLSVAMGNFAMEQFAKTTRFILTCNYLHKVIEPLQSRCHQITLETPTNLDDQILNRVCGILKKEKIKFERNDVQKYVKIYSPDIRKIINELQNNSIAGLLQPLDLTFFEGGDN